MNNIHLINQHIYIISPNEDINENDYIITKDGRLVEVSYLLSKDLEGASKVVLTTDGDLIKDGVQSIGDEFLEWFVNNPSCEEVEVVKGFADSTSYGFNFLDYKIIILKEEPKQLTDLEIAIKLEEIEREEPKQERMYSEEEVLNILYKHTEDLLAGKKMTLEQWFEQFKKK